ncbi:hypothetical protein TrLO_g737 [Triparma laevis f. longispina]|uniref:UTP-monosaccharide-1-phosphate uridylyltransferase n=1 Tax=Triparma laevis f. longispina TaxID=1714387 RepID=A0A9W6ZRW7_9STRA|nr:hypothetical protein TrLO_g737 [Triparma laevis f. longispina]
MPPPAPVDLKAFVKTIAKDEMALAKKLVDDGQGHLFAHWKNGKDAKKIKAQMATLMQLHKSYPLPDGLLSYTKNARDLLAVSKAGKNPLEGWSPSVPQGESLAVGTPEFDDFESLGGPLLSKVGFVLVAGGLGERLGYGGIKVELPTESCTETCYLQYYIETILSIQQKHGVVGKTHLPLAIMVSDDTYEKTNALLKRNKFFGMDKKYVTLMKQEKVAAISDNDGKIAQAEDDPYKIECKPHGHGDVHSLMHSTGTAARWLNAGLEYCVFFQDTNGLGFHTLAASLGVSSKLNLVMNSLAIPRKAKQAVGAVCQLTNGETKEERTINVEYNQLDPLLRATVSPDGDVNDKSTGFSPYPGNINQLLFSLKEYVDNLKETSGVMAEFVNPKYADVAKTVFKKPTRLECMMQDYPMVLKGDDTKRVGFTSVSADMCFSPVKNDTTAGAAAQASGTHPAVAFSGESDQYNAIAKIMRSVGCKLQAGEKKTFNSVTMVTGPKIVVKPGVCCQPGDYKATFAGGDKIKITGGSVLILKGMGKVVFNSLKLNGALVINTGGLKSETVFDNLVIENKGWTEVPAADGPEWVKMRGYTLDKTETAEIICSHHAGKPYKWGEGSVGGTVVEPVEGAEEDPKWNWDPVVEDKGGEAVGGGKGGGGGCCVIS